MQLADDDTLRTIDDKLTTANHDRDVAEIHFFLNWLLLDQSQPDTERHSVSQAKLPTLVRRITRLAEFIPNVLESKLRVVTCNREHFAQDRFQTNVQTIA